MTPNKRALSLALRALGVVLSILPPLICTLCYFPIWQAKGGEWVASGVTALLLILSALPLYKLFKRFLSSPSAYTVWLILFLIFLSLSRIADELTVISFVGFLSNLLGALCFRLGRYSGGGK